MLRALVLIPMSAAVSYSLGFGLSNNWNYKDSPIVKLLCADQSINVSSYHQGKKDTNPQDSKANTFPKTFANPKFSLDSPIVQLLCTDQSRKVSSFHQGKKDTNPQDSKANTFPQTFAKPKFSLTQSQLNQSNSQPTLPGLSRQTVSPKNFAKIQPSLPAATVIPPEIVKTLPIDRIVARSVGGDLLTMRFETVDAAPVKVPKTPRAEMISPIAKVEKQKKSELGANANNTNRPLGKLTFSSEVTWVNGSFYQMSNQAEDHPEIVFTVDAAPVKVPKKPRAQMISTFTPVSQSSFPLPGAPTPELVTAQSEIPAPGIAKVDKQTKSEVVANANNTNRSPGKLTFSSEVTWVKGSLDFFQKREQRISEQATVNKNSRKAMQSAKEGSQGVYKVRAQVTNTAPPHSLFHQEQYQKNTFAKGLLFQRSNQVEDHPEIILAHANLAASGNLAMVTFRELLPNGEQLREILPAPTIAQSTIAQSTIAQSRPTPSQGQSTEIVPLPTFEQPTQTLPSSQGQSTEIVPLPTFGKPTQTLPSPYPTDVTTPVPAVEPVSPVIDQTYTLGAGDLILITIFKMPEFSGEQQVGVDGSIKLPLVGKLSVDGMTLEEAEIAIAAKYQSELRSPAITVSLVKPRPLKIAISGEIKQPGSYILPFVNDGQFPSLAQAVQLAGGITQAADLEGVKIRRSQPSGITQTITLNLWALLQTGDLSQDLILRDGDVIMIPATLSVDLTKTAQLAASNLASTEEISDVAVVGEVFRPGAYRLEGGQNGTSRPTVSQAIQTAGGIKPSANVREIQVRRPTRDGTEQLININLWKLLQDGDLSQDLALQKGDTVIIPTAREITATEAAQIASTNLSPDVIRVNVAGEVKQPGTVEMPSNTTLNEALLSVGGFNERAEKIVELIRFNPDGSLTRREIEVNFKQGIDPQTNPLLSQNDIIIAGRSSYTKITDTISNILEPILKILNPLRSLF
ncbi:SLBB domain-containing protein [Moorena sp. SIO4A1]|uniref:SLBB domain-containing protein n=1 Tax=Moorena sp. SIO4A1 TaxID=2607835 RepID=UPI0025D46CB9|nr:SLBB domain-containing protein [Moorena sp. SIO4A1]